MVGASVAGNVQFRRDRRWKWSAVAAWLQSWWDCGKVFVSTTDGDSLGAVMFALDVSVNVDDGGTAHVVAWLAGLLEERHERGAVWRCRNNYSVRR